MAAPRARPSGVAEMVPAQHQADERACDRDDQAKNLDEDHLGERRSILTIMGIGAVLRRVLRGPDRAAQPRAQPASTLAASWPPCGVRSPLASPSSCSRPRSPARHAAADRLGRGALGPGAEPGPAPHPRRAEGRRKGREGGRRAACRPSPGEPAPTLPAGAFTRPLPAPPGRGLPPLLGGRQLHARLPGSDHARLLGGEPERRWLDRSEAGWAGRRLRAPLSPWTCAERTPPATGCCSRSSPRATPSSTRSRRTPATTGPRLARRVGTTAPRRATSTGSISTSKGDSTADRSGFVALRGLVLERSQGHSTPRGRSC